jgi:hypothetical protein
MVSEEAASRWTEQFTLNWDATLFMMNPKSRPEAVCTCDVYLGATLRLVIENRLI